MRQQCNAFAMSKHCAALRSKSPNHNGAQRLKTSCQAQTRHEGRPRWLWVVLPAAVPVAFIPLAHRNTTAHTCTMRACLSSIAAAQRNTTAHTCTMRAYMPSIATVQASIPTYGCSEVETARNHVLGAYAKPSSSDPGPQQRRRTPGSDDTMLSVNAMTTNQASSPHPHPGSRPPELWLCIFLCMKL